MNTNDEKFEHQEIEALLEDPEYRLAFEEEKLIAQLTEGLAGAMVERGWNQKELANALGVSPSYVTQLLRGQRNVSLRTLARMLFKLGKQAALEIGDLQQKPYALPESSAHYHQDGSGSIIVWRLPYSRSLPAVYRLQAQPGPRFEAWSQSEELQAIPSADIPMMGVWG